MIQTVHDAKHKSDQNSGKIRDKEELIVIYSIFKM